MKTKTTFSGLLQAQFVKPRYVRIVGLQTKAEWMTFLTELSTWLNHNASWKKLYIYMAPWQEASLAPPCSNLRSVGSKYTALKHCSLLLTLLGCPQSFGTPGIVPFASAHHYAPDYCTQRRASTNNGTDL